MLTNRGEIINLGCPQLDFMHDSIAYTYIVKSLPKQRVYSVPDGVHERDDDTFLVSTVVQVPHNLLVGTYFGSPLVYYFHTSIINHSYPCSDQ